MTKEEKMRDCGPNCRKPSRLQITGVTLEEAIDLLKFGNANLRKEVRSLIAKEIRQRRANII